jgi:acyl carrier protein
MVAFLESRFGIEIYEHELVPSNLDSLNRIADFVARKTAVPIKG